MRILPFGVPVSPVLLCDRLEGGPYSQLTFFVLFQI